MGETNLRKSQRIRAFKAARIVYDNGTRTRDCLIRNMSLGGVKLVMETTIDLPETFQLHLESGERRTCQVRWRKVSEIGVAFIETL